MKISVIIPAFGRQEVLIRCLLSLKHASHDDSLAEVCVVDDGSGLEAGLVMARVGAGSSFIWHAFDTPKGRSAARNKGVAATTGDIVIFLDADMEVTEGFLTAHRNAHLTHRHTAVIGKIRWPKGGGFFRYIGSRGVAKLPPGETPPPWYFVTGNASVERCDLPDGKPFDEHLEGWGGEDLDLGLRLASEGVAFMYEPYAESFHHFDGDVAGHVARTRRYGAQALPVLVDRYPSLEHTLRLDLLQSPMWRAAVHPVFSVPSLAFARLLDFLPLPSCLYDYLTFSAYAGGWLENCRHR